MLTIAVTTIAKKKKMETTKMSNTRGQSIKLKHVHRMDSFATILKKKVKNINN